MFAEQSHIGYSFMMKCIYNSYNDFLAGLYYDDDILMSTYLSTTVTYDNIYVNNSDNSIQIAMQYMVDTGIISFEKKPVIVLVG